MLLFLAGSLLSPTFLTSENLLNVLTRSSVIGIIAIGATFVITARGLDPSVGAMAALVAGLSILCMNAMLPTLGAMGALVAGLALALAFDGDALIDANIFYPPTLIAPAIEITAMRYATQSPIRGRYVLDSPLITKDNAEEILFPRQPVLSETGGRIRARPLSCSISPRLLSGHMLP